MKDRTHVPDKLEGYLLQTRHALFDLISYDTNRIVSVEAYDDVATEKGNFVVAEQIKSVLSGNNPLANRSSSVNRTLKKSGLGIECLRLHRLRHTVATRMSEQPGANTYQIMQLLGHTDIRTAKKYYIDQETEERAMRNKEFMKQMSNSGLLG